MMTVTPPPDDNNADNARMWGTDDNDSLTNAFPPHPFPIAPNADMEALVHLV